MLFQKHKMQFYFVISALGSFLLLLLRVMADLEYRKIDCISVESQARRQINAADPDKFFSSKSFW